MEFKPDIDQCLSVLQAGGVILYPTDTIWGLGCDATNPDAVEKIFEMKKRPSHKSMIILLADERDVLEYVTAPDLRVFDYLQSVHKPTTVIYEGAIGISPGLIGDDGSIAIRLVQDPFCRHLIKRLRKPLVSTSANISGRPSPTNFQEIDDGLKNAVDYVVKYRQNDESPSQSSAVIRWNKDGTATTLRP